MTGAPDRSRSSTAAETDSRRSRDVELGDDRRREFLGRVLLLIGASST